MRLSLADPPRLFSLFVDLLDRQRPVLDGQFHAVNLNVARGSPSVCGRSTPYNVQRWGCATGDTGSRMSRRIFWPSYNLQPERSANPGEPGQNNCRDRV